jgi:BirA family biotin operon repressor/biotin-[acetyl-CoA-carboxylase] ligase
MGPPWHPVCEWWEPAGRSRAGRILSLVSQPDATWSDARLAGTRFTDVRWFDRLDSTNRVLMEEAARGAPEGIVVVADEQSHGRGRLGRRWEAPAGASLLVSVLLRPAVPAERTGLLTMAAGLAAIEGVAQLSGIDARLKWPNDVVVADRKLAGILAEKSGDAVVLGIGVNVRWDSFPDELAAIATACNQESDRVVDRQDLLVAWLNAFEARLRAPDTVLGDARRRSATIGRMVCVELPGSSVIGAARALTDDGHLVVRDAEGRDHVVAAGDVVHLRPQ